MQRREFLYIAGLSGTGLVAGGGLVLETDSALGVSLIENTTTECGVTELTNGRSCSHRAVERVVIPAGGSMTLRETPSSRSSIIGELQYRVNANGSASIDVVEGELRFAGPYTKEAEHFAKLVENGAYQLPDDSELLYQSEQMRYRDGEATRLGRLTAANTFMFVKRDDGEWSAMHVVEAGTDSLVLDFVARV